MKKKLAVMAILLSAVCLIGFAQEVSNLESSRYMAKETEKKEYTFIVSGQVKINGEWVSKKEKFTIIDESLSKAQAKANKKFKALYASHKTKNLVITCESTKGVCQI